jgi:two-component system chemotaxis response regulator CheV
MDAFDRLELGGGVFEIIEFSLSRTDVNGNRVDGKYGVNVAKVREVVRLPKINPLASRVKSVAGLFELRGIPIPAIKLAEFLGDDNVELSPDMQIIVTEFSGKRAGFIVDSTSKIRRVQWNDVQPVSSENNASLNGMTLIEDNEFLFIVDLERIIASIENVIEGRDPNASYESMLSSSGISGELKTMEAPTKMGSNHFVSTDPAANVGPKAKLLLVDDSKFILDGIAGVLTNLGYKVVTAGDGLEAQNTLIRMVEENDPEPFDLVVTDVEMPKMNGMSLIKWIKEHEKLNNLPVVIHSSLSGKQSQEEGLSLGAQGYVIKNDVKQLDRLVKEILGENYVPGSLFMNAS